MCVFLLHPMQVLPADIPSAVLGEAWIVGDGAAIPSGAHHGDGGKQGTVARKVETETVGGLEVVTRKKIRVFGLVDEQGIDGGGGLP